MSTSYILAISKRREYWKCELTLPSGLIQYSVRHLVLLWAYKEWFDEVCLQYFMNQSYFCFIILVHGQSYNATQWASTVTVTNTHSLAIRTRKAKKPRDANVTLKNE